MPSQKPSNSSSINYTLYASYLAAMIVLMDLTSVNIALPTISRYFDMNMGQVSWLIMISMLSASSFALIAGKITEVWGAKRVLLIGFSIYIIGTFACFLTRRFEILILIRFFQGIGESLLYVVGPAFIRQSVPKSKQQSSYGIWMACTGIGIAAGPLLGGFLVDNLNWSWVFLINFPLSIIGLFMLFKVKLPRKLKIKRGETDFVGAMYSFLFLAGLIYGLNMINRFGFTSPYILVSIGLSILFLLLFIRREKVFVNPVFDLKLFMIRNFSLTALGFFLYFVVNVGSRFLRPFYFENERMLNAETSGLLMMVSPIMMMIISPMAKRISKRVHPNYLCLIGNVLLAISMFLFAFWDAETPLLTIILAMALLGIGMGLYYPTSSFVGMSSLPDDYSGMGSAAISTSKSMGKLIGVLIFASLFTIFSAQIIGIGSNVADSAFKFTFLSGGIIAMIATLISLFLRKTKKGLRSTL